MHASPNRVFSCRQHSTSRIQWYKARFSRTIFTHPSERLNAEIRAQKPPTHQGEKKGANSAPNDFLGVNRYLITKNLPFDDFRWRFGSHFQLQALGGVN